MKCIKPFWFRTRRCFKVVILQ